MTGLGAARALEDARAADPSIDWVLYEAEPRLGGKVHTVRRDGFVVEGGPDSAIIEKPWPIQMARRLEIGDRLLDSNEDVRRSFVYARGRLHELPEGIILMVPTRIVPFALSGLISWPGKLRMGMDLVLPRGGEAEDESLARFVRRRLGGEALARIAEPIVAGIHAGDPETMSVAATFPMFRQMEREHRSLILGMLARRKARERARAAGAASRAARPAPAARRRCQTSRARGAARAPRARGATSTPSRRASAISATRWPPRCPPSACAPGSPSRLSPSTTRAGDSRQRVGPTPWGLRAAATHSS